MWAIAFGLVHASGVSAPRAETTGDLRPQSANLVDCWDQFMDLVDDLFGEKDEEGDCPDEETEPSDDGDGGDSGSGGEGGAG